MEDPPYYGEGNKVTCLAPCQTQAKFRMSSDTQGELALSSLHSATRNSHNCPICYLTILTILTPPAKGAFSAMDTCYD